MRTLPFLALAVAAGLSACTDEEIVYVERPPFNDPADAASGFLGYYTSSDQQTTCGNCHADYQGAWKETGHAQAYATLKANPGAQPSCYSCHTINERGNDATGTVGHDKVQDSTYYDVQCESCHGPGLEHVEGVGAGNITNRPLAHIGIGPDTSAGCGACHNGTHHPFVEQWAVSRHALMTASPQTNPSCVRCHEGRGKLAALGIESNYAEKAGTAPQPITCAVCHAPHGSSNPGNLRLSVSSPEPQSNLCMSCHLNRVEPSGGSSRGNEPHGAQGGVLLGFAGWRPPNFAYDTARIYGSHATTANPKLCAGCHVNRFTVTDPQSGNFAFQSVGHQFEAAPCVNAQGVPTLEDDCEFTNAARNWSSCTASGCHANEDVAANLFNATRGNIEAFAAVLWVDTNANQKIDNYPTDDGYLPRIKAQTTDLNPSDNIVSGADGMEFNVRLCAEDRHGHPDGSFGTHNKFLCEALLVQGAAYLKSIYAFLPAPPAEIQALAEKWSKPIPPGPGQPQIKRERFPIMN